jgi:ABC-type transport system involved in multi-copper enzyme maturation permease subunit
VSLYTAETRRLVKRRFVKLLMIGTLLILAAVVVGMYFTNQKVGPAQIADAKVQAQHELQEQTRQVAVERQRCEAAAGTPEAANYPSNCAEIVGPTESDINPEWFLPPTFDFREKFGPMVTTLAVLLALMAFVVGASFVGAEWHSGGMMNLLLWRPQRIKVLSTKLLAVLVGLTALTTVTAVVWTGLFTLVARQRGSLAGMTAGAWRSFALMEVRALALVLVIGAVGFALASIGRHTAMALGVAIAVIVLFQYGLGVVLSLAKVKFLEAYLIPIWIQAWMDKKVVLEDNEACNFSAVNGCQPDTLTLTWPMAGALMALIFVAVVGAAMWSMRSRDIT